MAQFSISHRKTGGHEGGYHSEADSPNDRGGETWRGVARKRSPGDVWEGWAIIDKRKLESDFPKNLDSDPELLNLLVKFYMDNFWMPINGDSIQDQSVADRIYDVAVNSGPETAVKFLQTSLNLLNRNQQLWADISVDGKCGPKTIGTLATCIAKRGVQILLIDLVIEQGCNWRRIMLGDSSQEVNILSWYRRLHIEFDKES